MSALMEKIVEKIPTDTFSDTTLRNIIVGSNNSRYSFVKRAIRAGDLIHLRRGFYSLSKKYQRKGVNLFEVAQMIYGPSYISFESALAYHGWIPEAVYTVTSSCAKRSKDVPTPLGLFSYTHIPSNKFLAGVKRVESPNGIFLMATPWRALVDYVYANSKRWKGLKSVVESLRVDAINFKEVDFRLLEEIKEATKSSYVKKFIDSVKKELLT